LSPQTLKPGYGLICSVRLSPLSFAYTALFVNLFLTRRVLLAFSVLLRKIKLASGRHDWERWNKLCETKAFGREVQWRDIWGKCKPIYEFGCVVLNAENELREVELMSRI